MITEVRGNNSSFANVMLISPFILLINLVVFILLGNNAKIIATIKLQYSNNAVIVTGLEMSFSS